MKVQNKKQTNRGVIIIIVAIAVLLVAGLSMYLIRFNGTLLGWTPFPAANNSSINYGPATNEEKDTGTDIKEGAVTPPTETKPDTGELPTDTSTNVVLQIPYSEQTGDSLRITTLIGRVTSQGTCTLTLSRSGYTSVTQTVDVQAQSSSSVCKGFTIPTTGLAAGNWNLRIDYVDGDSKGSASRDQLIN